jgi:hypothetical protein
MGDASVSEARFIGVYPEFLIGSLMQIPTVEFHRSK